MSRLFLAAVIALGGGGLVLSFWIVRRRHADTVHGSSVSPAWLNENVYQKDGDRRWE